jgi:hypothetical protein
MIRALTVVVAVGHADVREEFVLQFRGAVTVGDDGNGLLATEFPTTVSGPNVHYVLMLENGCPAAGRPCPPPVSGLTVTLNDDIVFQNDDHFSEARSEVALNDVGVDDNSLVLAARGAPGSSARVRVLAVRETGNCAPCYGTAQATPTAYTSMQF